MGTFQVLLFIAFLIQANSGDPLLFGMGFLTREPNSFECRQDGTDQWRPCSKEEICANHLSHEDYRPVKDDEYIDNWEEPDKFDTLCTPQWKVGLLGSMFFVGAVSTLLFVPWLGDKAFGRKPVV
jgi:hypothetical protein